MFPSDTFGRSASENLSFAGELAKMVHAVRATISLLIRSSINMSTSHIAGLRGYYNRQVAGVREYDVMHGQREQRCCSWRRWFEPCSNICMELYE